jgi:hypothetical protein
MTHDQVRILEMIFYGAAIVVGGVVIGTMGRRHSGRWRLWLKVAWVVFVLTTCVQSVWFFASQGTGGIVASGLFLLAMAAAITYRTTHGGLAAWWATW